jgi:hypothetical protein
VYPRNRFQSLLLCRPCLAACAAHYFYALPPSTTGSGPSRRCPADGRFDEGTAAERRRQARPPTRRRCWATAPGQPGIQRPSGTSLDGAGDYADAERASIDTSQSFHASGWVRWIRTSGYPPDPAQQWAAASVSGFVLHVPRRPPAVRVSVKLPAGRSAARPRSRRPIFEPVGGQWYQLDRGVRRLRLRPFRCTSTGQPSAVTAAPRRPGSPGGGILVIGRGRFGGQSRRLRGRQPSIGRDACGLSP